MLSTAQSRPALLELCPPTNNSQLEVLHRRLHVGYNLIRRLVDCMPPGVIKESGEIVTSTTKQGLNLSREESPIR